MDRFENQIHRLGDPSPRTYLVVPHDANPLASVPQFLRVNVAGTVKYRAMLSDADVTETFAAGDVIWARVTHVRATGTTAANIVAYD